jgi:hypothetical protein
MSNSVLMFFYPLYEILCDKERFGFYRETQLDSLSEERRIQLWRSRAHCQNHAHLLCGVHTSIAALVIHGQ